jgi:hypothetical protein
MDCIGLQALSDSSESCNDDLSVSFHSNNNQRDDVANESNELVSKLDLNDDPSKRVKY